MNNPGIDLEIWKELRKKWTELDAQGHKIRVDFQLIAHPTEKNNILVIDVIQHIDDKPITETVQHSAGEAYGVLGIAGLSMEQLVQVLKGMMKQLHSQAKQRNMDLTLTMSPTSPTSGEVQGIFAMSNAPVQGSVVVNYRCYYVLNALRDQMIEATGDAWKRVRAVYHPDELEFYLEYQ